MAEEEGEETNLQLVRINVRDWSIESVELRGLPERSCFEGVAVGAGGVVLRSAEGRVYQLESGERPVPLDLPSGVVAAAVVAGPSFGACLSREGKLFVWGRVGVGAETVLATPSPSLVPAPEALSVVAAGTHVVVAASGRKVLTFGSNAEWGLGAGKDKKAVHRSCEVVLEAPADVAVLQTYGSYTAALTARGECFMWGGKKKYRTPTAIAVPANTVYVGVSSGYVAAVTNAGELLRKKDPFSKNEWVAFGAEVKATSSLRFCSEDVLLAQMRSSGRVAALQCGRSGEPTVLPTIRVAEFAAAGQGCAMLLNVHNTKNCVFGALHPEPLLRLATAKGFVKWLVSTGCKFTSDVMAFEFALQTVLRLAPVRKEAVAIAASPVAGFLLLLRKYYVPGNPTSSLGTRRLLEVLLRAPSTRPQDARAALTMAQQFMQESELTSLWSVETHHGRAAAAAAAPTSSRVAGGVSMEMDDVAAISPKLVAATLTHLRHKQFVSIDPAHIVRFAMISPDPSSFELFPNVAEYVDFGNTLGRWGKELVVKASSKSARGQRIRWLYQVLQELEALRNYDLCFHLSGALLWELMPELAKQAKVDLEAMFPTVKRFGDRKFWNGAYSQRLQEEQAVIPLLVYHSNLISGGSGGTDSVIERGGRRFLNISKFRAISDQLLLLRQLSDKCVAQAAPLPPDCGPALEYFLGVQVLSDAELTVLRAAIIPVSKFRESAKVTSLEGLAADLTASLSSLDRRLVKWRQLVRLLESDPESVRLRGAAFLVCPRDAVLDGGLLPGVVRALATKATDVVWLSPEYWLLRRIVRSVIPKLQFEDVILAFCGLLALAAESLPQAAEPLLSCFCDFAAGKAGVGVVQIVRALLVLQETANRTLPELEKNYQECAAQLEVLKKQDGELSRKQALMTIGAADGFENATVRYVKSKKNTVVDSSKMHEAKLAHFQAQRESVAALQAECRDVAMLMDYWNLSTVQAAAAPPVSFGHNFQLNFKYFLVRHIGSKWGDGAGEQFVHHEPDGLSRQEFQERLTMIYEPVFGAGALSFGGEEGDCAVVFFPVRRAEGTTGNVFVTETHEDAVKKRVRYECENLPTKRRWKVLAAQETALSPLESLVEDLQSRSGVLRDERDNRKRLGMLILQAVTPSSSWHQLLLRGAASCAQSPELHRAVFEYLQTMRDSLAALSEHLDDEEEARAHVVLCRSFDALAAVAVPLAGAGPPLQSGSGKPAFPHKMLHLYAVVRRANAAAEADPGASPAAGRLSMRLTSPAKDAARQRSVAEPAPAASRESAHESRPPRRDSAAPPLESPKRAEPNKPVAAVSTPPTRKESMSRESGSSDAGAVSPATRREPPAALAAAAAAAAASRPGMGSPGTSSSNSGSGSVPQAASSPLSPTLRTSGTQKLGEAKPSVILISSSANKDNTTGRRSGAVPVAGSAVSTFNRYEEQPAKSAPAPAPAAKVTSPGRTSGTAPAAGRVIVVDKGASAEDDKWKQLQQQMASASPKVRKAETEEDRRRQLEEIESLGMPNPLTK